MVTATGLTGEQIAQVGYQAGFRGDSLWRIVAITGRESSWNPQSHNTNAGTGDNSWGLAQINTLGTNGPVISRILGQLGYNPNNFAQLLDPLVNLRVAYVLSGSGTNWRPWGPYKGVSELTGTDPAAAQQAVARATSQGLLGQPLTGDQPPTQQQVDDAVNHVAGGISTVKNTVTDVATGWVKDLFTVAQPFLIYAVVLAGGAALIVLGARKAVDPIVKKQQQQAAELAPLAAAL